MRFSIAGVLLSLVLVSVVYAADDDFDDEYDTKPWTELAVQLPPAPSAKDLISFYVSAATVNQYAVDGSSISVGSDGVVRYVLVVQTPEGGRNVTFEGIRCETSERRIYASGHSDGSWAKSRRNDWVRIQDVAANRYHAALFLDYFCPYGTIVGDVPEALDALRKGGHPLRKRGTYAF